MFVKVIFLSIICFNSIPSSGQVADSIPCPKLELIAPRNNEIFKGHDAFIRVGSIKKKFVGYSTLTYSWHLSDGEIVRGQNSREITINTKNLVLKNVTVTLMIGGINQGCPSVASVVLDVSDKPPVIRMESKIIAVPAGQTPRN